MPEMKNRKNTVTEKNSDDNSPSETLARSYALWMPDRLTPMQVKHRLAPEAGINNSIWPDLRRERFEPSGHQPRQ